MVEKYDLFEVMRDMAAMMDGLEPNEQRQAVAALAERYKMKLAPQTTSNGSGYRPNPRRKTKPI